MSLLDRKILCEVELNCRTSFSKIAKRLRVNRNVVAYRVKNLEKNGVILKYICSVNLGLLGYKTYKICFKVWGGKSSEHDFVEELIKNNQVIYFLKQEGSFDYSISVVARSILELDEFLMGIKTRFKELIKDYLVTIVVYTRVFKLNKLLLDQNQTVLKFDKYSGEEEAILIDDKDKKILRELSQAANMPVVELAQKTRLSIDIIKYRLKFLSKSLINSYRIMYDISKLGYYHYVILLKIRAETKQEEQKLISWCYLKRNVLYITKRIGYYDFAINAAITDISDLNKFLAELKLKFGEMIDSYDTLINTKVLKLNYVPF